MTTDQEEYDYEEWEGDALLMRRKIGPVYWYCVK